MPADECDSERARSDIPRAFVSTVHIGAHAPPPRHLFVAARGAFARRLELAAAPARRSASRSPFLQPCCYQVSVSLSPDRKLDVLRRASARAMEHAPLMCPCTVRDRRGGTTTPQRYAADAGSACRDTSHKRVGRAARLSTVRIGAGCARCAGVVERNGETSLRRGASSSERSCSRTPAASTDGPQVHPAHIGRGAHLSSSARKRLRRPVQLLLARVVRDVRPP